MTGAAKVRRIGIMGGAFDPPHLAHQALAAAAIAQLQLDALRVVPTGQAWHKPTALSAADHRLAMAQLAFAHLPKVSIDARETARSGPSYTIDSLREISAEVGPAELFVIIGADQAQTLTTWRAWSEILQTAIICVADRADLARSDAPFDAEKDHPTRFCHLVLPPMAISATDIRAKISAHQDVNSLVCEAVARYIADHHLYQTV